MLKNSAEPPVSLLNSRKNRADLVIITIVRDFVKFISVMSCLSAKVLHLKSVEEITEGYPANVERVSVSGVSVGDCVDIVMCDCIKCYDTDTEYSCELCRPLSQLSAPHRLLFYLSDCVKFLAVIL